MIAQTAVDRIAMGNLALQQGNVALARRQYEESLILWRALDDAPGMAHALERLRTLERLPNRAPSPSDNPFPGLAGTPARGSASRGDFAVRGALSCDRARHLQQK